ncbi:hypothetical protein D3C80_1797440 [compost metagenome]
MTMLVAALVTHTFTSTVGAFAMGQVHDFLHCLLLDRIDGGCPKLRGQPQTI